METSPEEAPVLSVQVLDREECIGSLQRSAIGRVVLSVGCIPVALPVNMALFEGDVVFATNEGAKLDAAIHGNVVSVEVDNFDPMYHTGWSVLVTGVAELLTDPHDIERIHRLPLQPWAPGSDLYFVRVPSTMVTGRRIAWGPAARSPVAR